MSLVMPGDCKPQAGKLVQFHPLLLAVGLVYPVLSPPSTQVTVQVTSDREAFEVASIRENRSGSTARPLIRSQSSGLTATSSTAIDLIQYAFGVIERDVVGELPKWVRTTKFDVTARAANGPLTRSRALSMARALLEDRFQLDASYEQVTGPVYALAMARSNGAMGPRIRPSEAKCLVDPPLSADVERPTRTVGVSTKCGFAHLSDSSGLVGLYGTRVTMQQLAAYLSRVGGFERPVIDRTGLNGEFDFAVSPTSDMASPLSEVNFRTAMREQLGLVLRAERGTFEVLRIRRIQQPSPD